MQHRERILHIQEFSGVEVTNPYEEELIERLKEPTRRVAYLHQLMTDPPLWYKKIFHGDFKDKASLELFKSVYNKNAIANPKLKNPYTFIDTNWHPKSITTLRPIESRLREIGDLLSPIADWIRESPLEKSYADFADYVESSARLLPAGKFDELMIHYLQLPTSQRVRWMINLVEYLDDPLGVHASPEGEVAYNDRKQTQEANKDATLYDTVALEKYNRGLIPVKVFVSYMILSSGFLGVGRISAFNVPNDPRVSDKAGNAVIELFPDRISKKNQAKLAPALEKLTGVRSSDTDAETFVLAHEKAHGWRFKGETQRLGIQRSVVKEGLANRGGIGLANSKHFSEEHIRHVIYGHLAYAADDLGFASEEPDRKLRYLVTEPLGRNQPTYEQILEESGPYGVDAYLLARLGFVKEYIRHPMGVINEEGILKLAEEMIPVYTELAESGNEELVQKMLEEFIDRRKVFPLPGLLKDILSKLRQAGSVLVS